MDFLATFDDGAAWEPFTKWTDNNAFIYRNAQWAIDTSGCTNNFTFGPLLGQFVLGIADGGSSCNVSITPRNVPTEVRADKFLHVRMAIGHPVDQPTLSADHDHGRAAQGRSGAQRGLHRRCSACTADWAISRTRWPAKT